MKHLRIRFFDYVATINNNEIEVKAPLTVFTLKKPPYFT